MEERDFNNFVDELFVEIEDRLDELELDVDIDSSGGVLTVVMENQSQIIFSRQAASREIWIAARSGGFHLRQEDGGQGAPWRCGTTGESLAELVNRVFTEQSGDSVQVLA